MIQPWEEFVEGRPAPGPRREGWSPLGQVRHGTHLTSAIRVAEDGALTGDLIYDGVLRQTRTQVVYFSPNSWYEGSRYGTFEFVVSWASLVAGRQLHWVEAIRHYKHTIYRFLASRRNVSGLPVQPYDPVVDNGPIRLVGGEWFWATGFAAEIVVDEDLPLAEVETLTFEKHHDRFCSLGHGQACEEAGYGGQYAATARFLATILGRGLTTLDPALTTAGRPSGSVGFALSHLHRRLSGLGQFGGPLADDAMATDVLRAACLVLHAGDRERAKSLIGLIDTKDRFDRILLDLVRVHFATPDYDWD